MITLTVKKTSCILFIRTSSGWFKLKFSAPDTIFSLFSPLDTGFFVVIATALHSWGLWVVNWDRGLSAVKLFIRRFIKTGKLSVGAIKLDALVPEVFLEILLPLSMFEVIVPAPLISLIVLGLLAKKFVVDAFWGEHLSILSRYTTFLQRKRLKKTALHSYKHLVICLAIFVP